MNRKLVSFACATALFGSVAVGTSGQVHAQQQGGAAGLVAAVVQLDRTVTAGQFGLVNVGNSLNNLTALNNVLNNSPILSHNNITVTLQNISVLNGAQITALTNFLNNANVAIGQVLGVALLNTGAILVFV